MQKLLLWIARGVLTLLMFMSGVGPHDAQSNISNWFELLHLDRAAVATANWTVEPVLIWACAIFIVVSLLPNLMEAASKSGIIPKKIPPSRSRLSISADQALAAYSHAENPGWDGKRKIDYSSANKKGESSLVTFRKAGFPIPELPSDPVERAAIIKSFLDDIFQLVRDGHIGEAKRKAKEIVKRQ